MKKRNIVIGILVVLIIVVIVAIIVFNANNKKDIEDNNVIIDENIQIIEEGNIFLATVISNEENRIIVVPNENELISQSFKIINVIINNTNTAISKKDGLQVSVKDIEKNSIVKIEFDGKIISTNPTNILASKIEIQ